MPKGIILPIKVRNATGTSKDQDLIGNLERWKQYSGIDKPTCSQYGSFQKNDLVGAHIEVLEGKDKDIFIVPLEKSLNSQKEAAGVFYIKGDTILMPVSELKT